MNATLITECKVLIADFNINALQCFQYGKKGLSEEACECWTNSKMLWLTESIDKCKIKEDLDKFEEQNGKCSEVFGKCKEFEDNALEVAHPCTLGGNVFKMT